MDAEELRQLCLSLTNAVEDFPFSPGVSVFRLRAREGKKGKIFALSSLQNEPLKVSLKIDPELGESLRATYESIVPGYHLNKRHWVTVTLNGDADEIVRGLIEDSHALVAPRRKTRPSP